MTGVRVMFSPFCLHCQVFLSVGKFVPYNEVHCKVFFINFNVGKTMYGILENIHTSNSHSVSKIYTENFTLSGLSKC